MRSRRLLACVALLALAACASASDPDTAWRRMSVNQIRIDVMNNNFSDVTIWLVVRDARQERLGTVTGKTEETYLVPWDFSQPLRLELDLLAGPRCTTRAIDVDPGDTLQLEILAVFRETELCVAS